MFVRLVSKHNDETVINYSVAVHEIRKKPLSTYLAAQIHLIKHTAVEMYMAKQNMAQADEKESMKTGPFVDGEHKELFKELLASQTIFIPFDISIIRIV